jgi:hypothetical protein
MHEKQLCQILRPTLNGSNTILNAQPYHFKRKKLPGTRQTGCQHKKRKNCQECQTTKLSKRIPTIYRITINEKTINTTSLDKTLGNFENGTNLKIEKIGNYLDSTNFYKLFKIYGMSTCKGPQPSQNMHLKNYIMQLKKKVHFTLTIKLYSHDNVKKKAAQNISQISKTKNSWKRDLGKANMDTLIYIWACISKIQDKNKRNNALKKLKNTIAKRLNLQILPTQHLKFIHQKNFPLSQLKIWLLQILSQVYSKETLSRIGEITNIVTLNRPSIQKTLCNTREFSLQNQSAYNM